MSSLALETRLQSDAAALVAQITAAITQVALEPLDGADDLRGRAAILEAASRQAKAGEVELAAARLRVHAERRIGELLNAGERFPRGVDSRDWAMFRRLAAIPRAIKDPHAGSVDAMNAVLSGKSEEEIESARAKGAKNAGLIDLFEEAVAYQCRPRRSHTAYSVYMASLHLSAKTTPKYRWLQRAWDGTWIYTYEDPVNKKRRTKTAVGEMEAVLEERAILMHRVSPHTTKLLPVRGEDPLAQVLDHIRGAREALGDVWPNLSTHQKEELDGAYSLLDDLAGATVRAVNL